MAKRDPIYGMLKIGGAITVLILAGLILILLRLEKAVMRRNNWSQVRGS